MAHIFGALFLIGGYLTAAVVMLVMRADLAMALFPKYCDAAGLPFEACQGVATKIAAECLAALVLVLIVTVGLARKARHLPPPSPDPEPFAAPRVIMPVLLALLGVAMAVHWFNHRPGYHVEERTFLSIENLSWPLLLQLVFWTRSIRGKVVLAGYLGGLAWLLPFRNTAFSMLYFGLVVPAARLLALSTEFTRRTRLLAASVVICASVVVLATVVYQTDLRLGVAARAHPSEVERALTFRATVPFFGAVFLKHLAETGAPLPSFEASVARKFRLANVDLNEYAYEMLYGVKGGYQETPLYYGEAIANASISPFFWSFAAPLALVLIYFVLRPLCDLRVLISVALWRSSMGGLFDVAAALTIQIGFCLMLTFLQSKLHGPAKPELAE